MDKKYTHIHLYVEKYDKYEQFLLLDFVDKKEFGFFCQSLDFPVQYLDNEKTMLSFENVSFKKAHPREGLIYRIPIEYFASLSRERPNNDEPSSAVVVFRFILNSEQNFLLSAMFGRPVSEKRFVHIVSEKGDWNGPPCGAENLNSNIKVKVKKVGQGSWNEIYSDDICKIVFDIGSSILASENDCRALLKGNLALSDRPTLFISHWDIDHYNLLMYVSNKEISNLCCVFVPSECISLTSKNIVQRLEDHCTYLRPIKPFTNRLVKRKTSLRPLYSGKHYVLMGGEFSRNKNLSGLALIVWYSDGCAFLCADHSYYQVYENMKKAYHEYAKGLIAKSAILGITQKVNIVVPHHGGDGGKIESRYNINYPGQGVVSTGINKYGHPKDDVRAHFCKMGFIWSRLDHSHSDIILEL